MRGTSRGWAAQGYRSSYSSTDRGERSRVAIKRRVPWTQKGRTSSCPHPASVQAKARSWDRAPNIWRTRIFTAVRQKETVRLRRQMPIPNCTPSTAEQSTKTPGNPHARTCAYKAVDLQFLLIKAFSQKDYLSTLTGQGKRNRDYELRHHFSTSLCTLSVAGTLQLTQHTLHKCFPSCHQHFSVSLIPPTFISLTPKQQTRKKEVTN